MGLRIQTNIQSLNSQRNLVNSTEANSASMEKLSSGYRINKASDDAAGLAISENLKAGIRGLNVARRNANDGVSLVQTAEGGLNEVGNILSRLRELAVQSSSDTIGNTERGFLNKEYMQLKDEVDRISKSTEFNGTMLLVGDQESMPDSLKNRSNAFPLDIQVGKNWSEDIDGKDVRNSTNSIRIDLQTINAQTGGENSLGIGAVDDSDGTRVDDKENAQRSLAVLDTAITKVSEHRSYLGAIQSRLTSTITNLGIQVENNSAANSRIRDTDFAEESAKMVQSNIVKQSGIAILGQANQTPQAALRLLG